jgi:hypothetical protein
MQRRLFSILILVVAASRVEAGCIDPAMAAHSTVSITRHFDDEEQEARPGVVGIRATGWFLSPTLMVTVEHVAVAMKLSDRNWRQIEIGEGEGKQSTPARIKRVAGSNAQKIAVLELQTAFSGAQGFRLRMEPLAPEEPVVSLAGRFVQYGEGDKFAGTALLEMYDGNDRLVLDHGSSGAPVLDCAGRVVAVVSNLFTTTIPSISGAIRVSTAWGSPNVVSVPIPVLEDSAAVD